jgi:hypothetical protein
MPADQVPPKKFQNPPRHRKEVMLEFQIAISPYRDISPDISDQIPPEVAYCREDSVKLGNLPLLPS